MPNATTPVSALLAPLQSGGNAISQGYLVLSSEPLLATSTSAIVSVMSTATGGQAGIVVNQGQNFGLWAQASGATGTSTSGGWPNIKLQALQQYTDTGTYVAPDAATLVGAAGAASAVYLTDFSPHLIGFSPIPMPLVQFSIASTCSGTSTNTANVSLALYMVR